MILYMVEVVVGVVGVVRVRGRSSSRSSRSGDGSGKSTKYSPCLQLIWLGVCYGHVIRMDSTLVQGIPSK